MHFFSPAAFFQISVFDGASCALLAAAAAVRARNLGAHVTGALVLGCLCGLIGPLLREVFLHGAPGAGMVARELPADALVGAIGGWLALVICVKSRPRLFNALDGASIGMATSVGAVLALPELGIVGALTIGLINGLAPGLVRDMALGDTAMLVEKEWYATAAALGCIAAIAVAAIWRGGPALGPRHAWAVIIGFFVIICIRAWRMQKPEEIKT